MPNAYMDPEMFRPTNDMEIKEANPERISACLLILAAAALLGREHKLTPELVAISNMLAHPLLLVKQEPK